MNLGECGGDDHRVGDPDCNEGWCGSSGYPKQCLCGGLIHASWGVDGNYEDDYWLYTRCDKCGESEH